MRKTGTMWLIDNYKMKITNDNGVFTAVLLVDKMLYDDYSDITEDDMSHFV